MKGYELSLNGIRVITTLHSQDLRNERAELESSRPFTGGTLKVQRVLWISPKDRCYSDKPVMKLLVTSNSNGDVAAVSFNTQYNGKD